MSYQEAFDSFMQEFDSACDKVTEASYSMSGYSVELCSDGSYRVIWNNNLGNRYDSPGILLGIPPLTEDETDDDPDLNFYNRAEQAMKDKFEEAMKLLEESEKCGECWGSGKILLDAGYEVSCLNCDGTGRTD